MDFKKIRTDLGLTQMEITKIFGITLNAYIRWEKGISKPNEENQKVVDEFLKKEGYKYEE